MEMMITFSRELLGSIADFLMAEPIIYLFTICCLVFVVKVFRVLMP